MKRFRLPNYDLGNVELLCYEVGLCLMQIQTLENTVENYLALVHKIKKETAREEAERIFEKCSKMTLGTLFKEIMQIEELPQKLNERVTSFVKERNWLVHKCRKENEANVYNLEKFSSTILRIRKIADESLALAKEFLTKSDRYLINNGIVTKEELDYRTQKVLDSYSGK